MKTALVCDDLVQHGGHEKIIMEFCEMYPDAVLYSTFISKKWQKILKEKNIAYVTSFMQKFPFAEKLNRVYAPFLFYIIAIENFNFDSYDLVISLSSRFAHGIITKPGTTHICYMSTVGRMFWEPSAYFQKETFGVFKPLKSLGLSFLKPFISYIRLWDRTASQRVDYFISNSKTTQNRIKKYYGRESEIIHPPVDLQEFNKEVEKIDEIYFFVLTRLAPWKRVDLAVSACKDLNIKLKISGQGPARKSLEKLAEGSDYIEFLGHCNQDDKVKYLQNCQALINTQYEDFGIVPLEAMACGKPILAFGKGGALETVIAGKTGEFFSTQDKESLKKVIQEFDPDKYSSGDCVEQSKKFEKKLFIKRVVNFIDSHVDVHIDGD